MSIEVYAKSTTGRFSMVMEIPSTLTEINAPQLRRLICRTQRLLNVHVGVGDIYLSHTPRNVAREDENLVPLLLSTSPNNPLLFEAIANVAICQQNNLCVL